MLSKLIKESDPEQDTRAREQQKTLHKKCTKLEQQLKQYESGSNLQKKTMHSPLTEKACILKKYLVELQKEYPELQASGAKQTVSPNKLRDI